MNKNIGYLIAGITLLVMLPLVFMNIEMNGINSRSFHPAEIRGVLDNPFIGWAPSAEGGPYEQNHRLVYVNVTWRELEPRKGICDFAAFEEKYRFSYWKNRNVKIIFRLNMDFPGTEKHLDIPDWLYEETAGAGTWYDTDYGIGFSPDYSNPILIKYHELLIRMLAERYNSNGPIAAVALGSLGHWGEWHTKQGPDVKIPFPEAKLSNMYYEHYTKYFKDKILLIRRPFNIALGRNTGLFNDSFGNFEQTEKYFMDYINKGYFDYLAGEFQQPMPDYWKNAPSGGEVANPPGMDCFNDNSIKATLDMIRKSHTSWLGPSCPAYLAYGAPFQKNIDEALNTMGYRFVLETVSHEKNVSPGGSLEVSMLWINKGVAPFYLRWPLELSLSDSENKTALSCLTDDDIRTWLPGRIKTSFSISIPPDLKEGNYTLCAAVLDPETGKPALEFAIEGKRHDGRYTLNEVVVRKQEHR